MRSSLLLLLGCIALSSCDARTAARAEPPAAEADGTPDASAPVLAPVAREVAALVHRWHEAAIGEIVVEPAGTAALTLDADGEVRLWPELAGAADRAPFAVLAHEPASMSLARAGKAAFVATFVDTAGAGRVVRIELDGDRATETELFEVPASDPLFELHALDGGERFVALGIDHRVRMYDASGKLVAILDQPGFVPYQLRIAQRPGQAPSMVAVLVKPVSVQAIAIAEDRLEVQGEPRQVGLDQSPNRNDLQITADGGSVLAMRRPKGRTQEWWLERIELASGKRFKIAGQADTKARPRLHVVDERRVLLDTGSGVAQWVDLDHAVEVPIGTLAPPVPEAITTGALSHAAVETRMRSVVVHGVRAVPKGPALVVAPLEGDPIVHGRESMPVTAVALDEHGEQVAWAEDGTLFVASIDATDRARSFPGPATTVVTLAFVGDHVLVASQDGEVRLVAIADGKTSASVRASRREIEAGRFDRERGLLALQPLHPALPLRIVAVKDGTLGEPSELPKAERGQWPELANLRARARADEAKRLGLRLRAGAVKRFASNGDHTRMAVVQAVPSGNLRDEIGTTVSVHDLATGERLWTRPIGDTRATGWAADGTRVALADAKGVLVVDAATGAAIARPD